VSKTRPQARFALARLIRVSCSLTELLLDLHDAVFQDRELGDGHLVGQDGPPRPELNRLGLSLFGERDDPIGRLHSAEIAVGLFGHPVPRGSWTACGRASGPISCCGNEMPTEDPRVEGTPKVRKSGTKWDFYSEIPASVH
jgi:hypothetical protein